MPRSQITTINTKYGPTNKTEIENGIRQGKVPELVLCQDQSLDREVDEVEVELRAEGLRIKHGHLMISSLLFMDDDITITSLYIARPMLTVLEYVCNKWYLKINYKKSGILIFNSKYSKTDNSKIIAGSEAYSIN